MDPYIKVTKKFTKKFVSKGINRQYCHRKTGLKYVLNVEILRGSVKLLNVITLPFSSYD